MKVIYFIQLAIIVAVFMWSIKIIFSNFVFNDRLSLLEDNIGIEGRSSGQRVELPIPEEEFPTPTTATTETTSEDTVTMAIDDQDSFTRNSTAFPDSMATDSSIELTTESASDLDNIGTTSMDMSTDFLSFFTENPTTPDLGITQSVSGISDSTRSNTESSTSTVRPETDSSATTSNTIDASSTEVPASLATDISSAESTGSTTDLDTEIPSSTTAIDSTFDLATEVPESLSTDVSLAESPQTTTIGDTFELTTEVPESLSTEILVTDFSTSLASFVPAETMAVSTTESLESTESFTEQAVPTNTARSFTDSNAEFTESLSVSTPLSTENESAITTAIPSSFEPNGPISTTEAAGLTERIDLEIDRPIPTSFDQNGAITSTAIPTSLALTEEPADEVTTLSSNTFPSVDAVTLDESTTASGNSITTRSVSDDDDGGEFSTQPTTISESPTPNSITNTPDSGSDIPAAVNTTSRSFVEYSSESSEAGSETTMTTISPDTEATTPSLPTTSAKPTTPLSKTAPARPSNNRPGWMRFLPHPAWNAKLPPCPPGSSMNGWGPSDQQEPMETSFFGSGQSITSRIHKLWARMFRLNQFRCEISQERRSIQYGLIQALDQYRDKLSKEILALSETLKLGDRWYMPNMMQQPNKIQEELIRLNQLLQLTIQYFKVLNRFNYFEWLQN